MKINLKTIIASIVIAGAISVASAQEQIKIRGAATGNWWSSGETVQFKAEKVPDSIKAVKAELKDSSGKTISSDVLTSEDFKNNGWTWKAKEPGFYVVKFIAQNNDGSETEIAETIPCKIYKKLDGGTQLREKAFTRAEHNIVVTAAPTRKAEDIPEIIGLSIGWGVSGKNKEITFDLITKFGFNFLRMHPFPWDQIEKKDGEFDWTVTDNIVKGGQERGFKNFIANPFGTPQWASPYPEKTNVNICVKEYSAYAPKDIEKWNRFIKEAVTRYPMIQKWEIWNEQHLPGQSCFWNDSPENYVVLLKNAFNTIRKNRPDAKVLIGGMGMRYLSFYEEIMKKSDAAKYFDEISMHGKWPDAQQFNKIEKEAGYQGNKPWVSTEWHAILLNPGDEILSEEQLSMNMMLDFMSQVKLGADQIAFFELTNLVEKETLGFYKENGAFTHSSGLFRSKPYNEPRLPALVLRTFIDSISGKVKFIDSYAFDNQNAALYESKAGKVLVFWRASDTPVKLEAEILKAVNAKSDCIDWEGKTQKLSPSFMVEPFKMYLVKNPDISVISKWSNKAQVFKKYRKEPVQENKYNALYHTENIFDANMNPTANLKMTKLPVYVGLAESKNADFAASFALSCNTGGLELLVEVTDKEQVQNATDNRVWDGDSIQFALDCSGKGYTDERLEFSAALCGKAPLLWKEKAPSLGGDLPARFTPEKKQVQYGKVAIDRNGNKTVYKIRIDRDDLYPFAYMQNQPLRFSILVNNNDGKGRGGYLEWGSGIGASKDCAEYGNLTRAAASLPLFTQADLKNSWGNAKLEKTAESLKVLSTAGDSKGPAALATATVKAPGGVRYNVSFEAKGDIKLHGMFNIKAAGQEKTDRLDFIKRTQLTGEFKKFDASLILPMETETLNLSLFAWQENGYFEIKNFTMSPAED